MGLSHDSPMTNYAMNKTLSVSRQLNQKKNEKKTLLTKNIFTCQ